MVEKIDQAAAAVHEFTKSRDIGALESAVDALEEFDIWSIQPDLRLEARRRLLLNWGRVLVAIDSIKEPGFDAESERTTMYPDPPPGHTSGVSPKSIRDPKVRASYQAAIAENEKKKARDRVQLLAIEFEDRALRSMHRALERLYTPSAADQKEIDAVFQESGLSEPRRKQVREG